MRIVLLLFLVSIAGCAVGPSRSEVLAGLVGRPERDALRVLGAPNRVIEANGSQFLAYDDQRLDAAPAFLPVGYGYLPAPPVTYWRTCETTVEVSGGVVRSWTLRGSGC